ncbi:MAG: isoaspartyl peptidase/L-asparaginase [Polyangiaceae bacterium]
MADVERVTGSWGSPASEWSIVVHGGAGHVSGEYAPLHEAGARKAVEIAGVVLAEGGSALDAVERAVMVLEDDPVFNAGKGACLNERGETQLDAAIMDGHTLRAGAVCALSPFANPIRVARAVHDDDRHVLYAGEGADAFAVARGFTRLPVDALVTPRAREVWEKLRGGRGVSNWAGGTVGAVARDSKGRIAAATSTGGLINKGWGRVGDSPILGAGTYADDHAGGGSTTGDGEAVLRLCLTKSAVEWMRGGAPPEDAARMAVGTLVDRVGGQGGIILVDRHGRVGLARSTKTMTWAALQKVHGTVMSGL